ncbi:TBC1 domain family member 15-like [Canna indica]|uniref:TBC1 domain family member 15-like n=1 Tax=Canna indica TaxID=4628 RepID=A0AAQ3QQV8_9LILI|nr:TBC1 domain family member 15-like [Canna indica]
MLPSYFTSILLLMLAISNLLKPASASKNTKQSRSKILIPYRRRSESYRFRCTTVQDQSSTPPPPKSREAIGVQELNFGSEDGRIDERFLGSCVVFVFGSMFKCCALVLEDWGEPDAFYPIKPDCLDDVPVSRFRPKPGKTLSARRWRSSFSDEGYLDIARVLRRIQRGGVHPSIKGEVWEFLLGCYDPKSTFDERTQLRQKRRSEYDKLKSKCREMEKTVGSGRIVITPVISEDGEPIEDPFNNGTSLGQEMQSNEVDSTLLERKDDNVALDKEVIQWKLTLHQIVGLDVVRTDRALLYYENPENQARLWDVLAVYSWIDRDIGYCQGMSDLCSPIIILIENEADAFWCFEHLMRRVLIWSMEYNPHLFFIYESDAPANKMQDAPGNEDLRKYGKFQRENIRSGQKDPQVTLSIFLVASVLEAKNKMLLLEAKGLADVVKQILNDITGQLDAKKACDEALKLHIKYMNKVCLF